MPKKEIKPNPLTIEELRHWNSISGVCHCEMCVRVRTYYKVNIFLHCKDCNWLSEPYPPDYMPVGFGGILDCPECHKANRNPNLEGCYGSIEVIEG